MELKTNYQYTYFIHPFVIKENKYQKFLLKMLKDKNSNLKLFKKEKDLRLYQYFSPNIKKTMFSSFSFTNEKLSSLEELPIDTRAAILAKSPCTLFEYQLEKDIQGKTGNDKGLFFKIQKIEVICFKSGICFLSIKTNVEDSKSFSDVLNFNYKFRDINQEGENILNNYDNIRLQTDSFSDVSKFTDFIKEITGSNLEAMKLDINTERFLTYSYVCIDQEAWNKDNHFEGIKHDFIKYANILPADNMANLTGEEVKTFSKWKYAQIGITKQGVTLLTSSMDMNNYTILPEEYENQYFYTYIINLYKKIYLKKLQNEFKNGYNINKTKKKFVDFTKKIWIEEITEDEAGALLNHKIKDVLEIEKLYYKVKNEYDIFYKALNIEKNRKATIAIVITLVISLIFNILNYIQLLK